MASAGPSRAFAPVATAASATAATQKLPSLSREHAPTSISLHNTHMSSMPSHSTDLASGGALTSPCLPSANELPDDPREASKLAALFPPSLQPAWSPDNQAMARSSSGRDDEGALYLPPAHAPSRGARPLSMTFSPGARSPGARSPGARSPGARSSGARSSGALSPGPTYAHAGLGSPRPSAARLSSPGPPSSAPRRRTAEPDLFERTIEHAGHPHWLTPQAAIDVAVPSVLDEAADAIVGESTLEVVAPRDTARGVSPARRSTVRRSAEPVPSLPTGPSSPHGLSQAGSRRSMVHPPTPTLRGEPMAPSMSPSLSIDGAIIPEGRAATITHSLDGMADAISHLSMDGELSASSSMRSMHPDDARPSRFRYTMYDVGKSHDRPPERWRSSGSARPASYTAGLRGSRYLPPDVDHGDHVFLQVPGAVAPASPSSQSGSERKRLSWMSYADLVHDAHEQVVDVDTSMRRPGGLRS